MPIDTTTDGNLVVLEDQTKLAADRSTAVITVESTNPDFPRAIEELQGTTARHMAIGHAAKLGVPDPRQNGNVIGPYPVNAKGVPLDKVAENAGSRPLPPQHPEMQPAAYRVDVPICRKLV